MKDVTKNYDVCDISDFQDSINRKRVEDNTKTNFKSHWVAKFQNLNTLPLINNVNYNNKT